MAVVTHNDLPLMLNTSTIRFRSLDECKLVSNYLYYFLQSRDFYQQITRQSQGSAQVNYGPSHLQKVKMLLPNVFEQQKIAELLGLIDFEINGTLSYISSLQEQKRGLMQQLLTGTVRVAVEE